MKKLIIVDDHALLREGISSWISKNSDWNIFITAENIDDLKKKFAGKSQLSESAEPDDICVAVVDLSFGSSESGGSDYSGLDIVSWLRDKKIPAVVFSSYSSGYCIEKAMSPSVGAKGYVSKCSTEKTLLEAIDTVASGKTYIQPDLFSNMIRTHSLFQALSHKEQIIAELIVQGFENIEIADKTELNIRTVENYVSKLYDKCGTNNRKGLIALLSK